VDGYVLSRCDGQTLAREILRASPFGVEAAQRSLYGLLSTGVVQYPAPVLAAPSVVAQPQSSLEASSEEAAFEQEGLGAAGEEAAAQALPLTEERVATTPPASGPQAPPLSAPPAAPPAESELPAPPERKRDPFIDVETIPIRLTEIGDALAAGTAAKVASESAKATGTMDARRAEVVMMWEALATRTHYEILGISWDAEEAEIREAYYRLARRFHPDAHHEATLHDMRGRLEDIFVRLGEAYEVLRNWHLRASYERKVGHSRPEYPSDSDPEARAKRAESDIAKAADSLARDRAWEAIRLLESALPHASGRTRSRGRILLASVYSRSVYWAKQAEDLLRSAQREDPLYAEAHLALARLYASQGLTVRAVSAAKRALELAPASTEARSFLAEVSRQGSSGRGGLLGKLLSKR
jgi:curved DNA-binding protein CbpA